MGKRLRRKRSGKRLRRKRSGKRKREKLPDDVFDDILSRLPVKDLLRFRCVSKQWCALIDSPRFIKLQLNRSLETRTNLSLIFTGGNNINTVDLDLLDGVLKLGGRVSRLDFVEVDNPIKSEISGTSVEGSCNGLICLHCFIDEAIALLNPSTKEYRILPPVPPPVDDEYKESLLAFIQIVHGIVYDPVGDDYKVLRIVQFKNVSLSILPEVMVYGLRSNMWRRICESFTYHLFLPWKKSSGVFVNGALHWLACRDRVDLFDIVVAFDPVDEEHWEVQVPQVSSCNFRTLGVLGGCLCVFYAIDVMEEACVEFTVELWVMNDYMVEESWTKLFRVTLPNIKDIERYRMQFPTILAHSKSSREVILLQMFGNLIWYDLKEKRFMDLGICPFGADIIRMKLKVHGSIIVAVIYKDVWFCLCCFLALTMVFYLFILLNVVI